MKNIRRPAKILLCSKLEVVLLSMLMFVLISFYRYFDFVTSFQTVSFVGNFVATKMMLHNYSNVHVKSTTRTRQHTDNKTLSEIAKDSYGIYIYPNRNICSNVTNLLVVVLVHTASEHFERRRFIRNTWGNINKFESDKVRVAFLLGKPEKMQYQTAIKLENEQNSDIVQGTFQDTYHNLTYKAILGLRWVSENCGQAKFILKIDDDVVVNTPQLLKLFTTKYARAMHSIFCAEVRPKNTARIYRGGKYKVEQTLFPNVTYYPVTYCPGRYLIYTSDIIKGLVSAVDETQFLWLDDVYVTGMLAAKVGNVTHLIVKDITRQMEWLENANTRRMLDAWNRFTNSNK